MSIVNNLLNVDPNFGHQTSVVIVQNILNRQTLKTFNRFIDNIDILKYLENIEIDNINIEFN